MTVWWITLFSTYFLCLFARVNGKYKYVKGERVFRANAVFAGMACAVLIFVSGFRAEYWRYWNISTDLFNKGYQLSFV